MTAPLHGDEKEGLIWLMGLLDLAPQHRSTLAVLAAFYEARAQEDPQMKTLAQKYRRMYDAAPREEEAKPTPK